MVIDRFAKHAAGNETISLSSKATPRDALRIWNEENATIAATIAKAIPTITAARGRLAADVARTRFGGGAVG